MQITPLSRIQMLNAHFTASNTTDVKESKQKQIKDDGNLSFNSKTQHVVWAGLHMDDFLREKAVNLRLKTRDMMEESYKDVITHFSICLI